MFGYFPELSLLKSYWLVINSIILSFLVAVQGGKMQLRVSMLEIVNCSIVPFVMSRFVVVFFTLCNKFIVLLHC